MKQLVGIIFLFLSAEFSTAQINLVPNNSFEIYDTCPFSNDQINVCTYWFQPNRIDPPGDQQGSTDYFNTCSSTNSIPLNWPGFQIPHSGNGYVGFASDLFYYDSIAREYLEVGLTSTLINGNKYCVSSHLSLSNQSQLSNSAIGFYFSNDTLAYISNNYATINVSPQVRQPYDSILSDTLNWMLVKGSFIAQGGERFLTIGNFWNPPNINYQCMGPQCAGAYYYIDDVSVVELPELAAAGDDSVCAGDSVALSGFISQNWPGMQFEWLPHTGLANPLMLNTTAAPNTSTTYTLTVSCPSCNVPCLDELRDTVRIGINTCEPPITNTIIPTVIHTGAVWQIQPAVTTLKIFDARGRLVFETENYQNNWSPENGSSAVYFFELTFADGEIRNGKLVVYK